MNDGTKRGAEIANSAQLDSAVDRMAQNHQEMKPGRYYVSRALRRESAYGDNDWRQAVDPDGVVRDRTTERLRYLDDIRHELDYVNGLQPGRILDIGCGLGFFLSGVSSAWEKHGVEMSEFAISRASEWGRIARGPLKAAEYRSASFDVVVMHHVIEHLEMPEDTIAEVRRLLRPGGRLVLGTPDFDSGCARRFGPRFRLLHDPTHVSLFTYESMRRLLQDAGFLVEFVDFPFFETRHFTEKNLLRLFDVNNVSPPFYGSFMTFYCRKPVGGRFTATLQHLGGFAPHELLDIDVWADLAVRAAGEVVKGEGKLHLRFNSESLLSDSLANGRWCDQARDCAEGVVNRLIARSSAAVRPDDGVISISRAGEDLSIEVAKASLAKDGQESGAGLGALRLPIHFGQTAVAVEIAIVGGLLRELTLREFDSELEFL